MIMTSEREFISQLIAARRAMCLTQQQVADKLHTSRSWVCDLEKLRYHPTLERMIRYAWALGVDVHFEVQPHPIKARLKAVSAHSPFHEGRCVAQDCTCAEFRT